MSRFFNFDQPQPLNLDQTQHRSLQQLLLELRERIEGQGQSYWVVAEIADLRRPSSGHLYFECVQRQGDELLAKCRAVCWRAMADRLVSSFERTTGVTLKPGMEVLMRVGLSFHPVYGFTLTLQEIDASFTLGEMARRRQAIIERLKDEGLFSKNSSCEMALVPRRLALISSPTAAGFEDFCEHISAAATNYSVAVDLYPALMQGVGAEAAILAQIKRVVSSFEEYDALVIVRGGGAITDLSCFDSYRLAVAVARAPLPVVVGIGHERDSSVVDLVAHSSLKTPTAVAAFFGERIAAFAERLDENARALLEVSEVVLARAREKVRWEAEALAVRLQQRLQRQRHILTVHAQSLQGAARRIFLAQRLQLRSSGETVVRLARQRLRAAGLKVAGLCSLLRAFDPRRLLQRGYTLTYAGGRLVKDLDDLAPGAEITTVARGGSVTSKVLNVEME